MHVLHIRGGSKASWERLHRDQDIDHLPAKAGEAKEFEEALIDLG